MFAERQVVLLKEAQQMRDVEKLESYMENPLHSTVFVVSYKCWFAAHETMLMIQRSKTPSSSKSLQERRIILCYFGD